MRCVECFFENPAGTARCRSCGTSLPNDKGTAAAERLAIEAAQERRGYFSFGKFISPTVVQAIYVLGAVAISLAGLLMIALALSGLAPEYTDISRDMLLIGGPALLLIGNILWRMLCEMVIILFRIHEALAKLDHKAWVLIALLTEQK